MAERDLRMMLYRGVRRDIALAVSLTRETQRVEENRPAVRHLASHKADVFSRGWWVTVGLATALHYVHSSHVIPDIEFERGLPLETP